MNDFYLYQYESTKLQFLSTANPTLMQVYCEQNNHPKIKLIGVWKFKKMK